MNWQKISRILRMGDHPRTSLAPKTEPNCADKTQLPELTASEYRQYDRCAVRMNMFVSNTWSQYIPSGLINQLRQHNMFRRSWTVMHEACTANKRPAGMTLHQFLRFGLDFCQHLEGHHGLEESMIFPFLARKMPAFRKELELLTQHKQIHAGLHDLQAYLRESRDGTRDFRMQEMKEIMDGFGTVLWEHLNDEVEQLGAENMRKYWTLEEMRNIPM